MTTENDKNWAEDNVDGKTVLRPVKIPVLSFDSSGSAVARFFGNIAEVTIHWISAEEQLENPQLAVGQKQMLCPLSIAPLLPPENFKCSACFKEKGSATRHVVMAYDVPKKAWSVYLAHPFILKKIMDAARECGATPKMMVDGTGPDIILQKIGQNTEVQTLPETMGKVKEIEELKPAFESILLGLARYSVWNEDNRDVRSTLGFGTRPSYGLRQITIPLDNPNAAVEREAAAARARAEVQRQEDNNLIAPVIDENANPIIPRNWTWHSEIERAPRQWQDPPKIKPKPKPKPVSEKKPPIIRKKARDRWDLL